MDHSPRLITYDLRRWIGLFLGPCLFLSVGLGAPDTLSPEARWMAGIVLLMATWWITEPVPLWLTAALPILFFPLLQIAPVFDTTVQYFDPINFLFLGGMLIAASMQQWGLHRRIALSIVSRLGANPRRLVAGFMLATTFITLWISNTATAVMMFPIAMALILKLREKAGPQDEPLLKRFALVLMLGIAYAASIGGVGTKIGTGPNMIFVKQAGDLLNRDIDFLTWLKIGLPLVIITVPLVWCYLVFWVGKLPSTEFAGGSEILAREKASLGRMNPGEVVAMIAFVSAAFLWIFRKDMDFDGWVLKGWSRLVPFELEDVIGRPLESLPPAVAKLLSTDIGDGVVGMTIGVGLLLIPVSIKPLQTALGPSQLRHVSWDMLILLGGGFAMAFGIQKSGLSKVLGSWLTHAPQLTPLLSLFLVCLVTTALTEVASNSATASILVPLLAAGGTTFGIDPLVLMFAATMSASFGFMLPAGTPANAIAFSSGYISVPQMARSGFAVDMLGVMVIGLGAYYLVPWALKL